MKRREPVITLLLAGIIILGLCAAVHGDRDAFVLALMDREAAMSDPLLADCQAYAISGEKVLIMASKNLEDRVPALVGLAAPAEGTSLWVTPAAITEETARKLGLEIILTEGVNTVFAAPDDAAYGLMAEGYFAVRMDFVPLRRLQPDAWRPAMAEEMLDRRPLDGRRVRFIKALVDSVDTLRLKETLHFLEYDDANGRYRSRFQVRPETRQEVVPYLSDALGSYLVPHGGDVVKQEYVKKIGGAYACVDTIPCDTVFTNIIATKPGRRTSAHYIICAHYDAIGVRTPGWVSTWYKEDVPAPGADDNGTGVASVLECARLLSGLELDVGIKFILFSGEELGLLGSQYYVANLAPEDSVIGVVNFDMVGFVDQTPIVELVYDWKSRWISDQLEDVGRAIDVESTVEQVNLSGVANSDHSSFWQIGVPATMMIEELEAIGDSRGSPVNPYYHTVHDVVDNLDMRLVRDAVSLAVGMVSRFSDLPEDSLSDIWLTEGSAELDWPGRRLGQPPVAGDSLSVELRALNVGAAMGQLEPYTFEIWLGPRNTGELIHQSTEMVEVLEGAHTLIGSSWRSDPQTYGDVSFTFVLLPTEDGVESDLSNNTIDVTLTIMPVTAQIRDLHVIPNPVSFTEGQPQLCFEILHPEGDFNAVMDVWIFDILGSTVGHTLLQDTPLVHDFGLGNNSVDLSRIVRGDIAPGLYICRTQLRLLGEPGTFDTKFKFAVDR
jgi:hypothetical protein